ncbi:hypothetical protein [Gimesia alba]|nr:hypothetical protein [Gimesia alba]
MSEKFDPTCNQLFEDLIKGKDVIEQPEAETWVETLKRLSTENQIAQISRSVWFYFRESVDPKYQGNDWFVSSGEGMTFLFWRNKNSFLGRQISSEEIKKIEDTVDLP